MLVYFLTMKISLEGYKLIFNRKTYLKIIFRLKNIKNGLNLAYFEVQTRKDRVLFYILKIELLTSASSNLKIGQIFTILNILKLKTSFKYAFYALVSAYGLLVKIIVLFLLGGSHGNLNHMGFQNFSWNLRISHG